MWEDILEKDTALDLIDKIFSTKGVEKALDTGKVCPR